MVWVVPKVIPRVFSHGNNNEYSEQVNRASFRQQKIAFSIATAIGSAFLTAVNKSFTVSKAPYYFERKLQSVVVVSSLKLVLIKRTNETVG